MPRYTSSVSPKGQITIPVEMREKFGIDPRDRVTFEVGDDFIIVRPLRSPVDELYRSVPEPNEPHDWKTVRANAWEEHADHVASEGIYPESTEKS